MNKIEILAALHARSKGQLASVKVNRPAKLRAAFKNEDVRKESIYQLQLCAYGARNVVKRAVNDGEREKPQLPSYVASSERDEKTGLNFWYGKNGKTYLALPVFGNNCKAKWLKDGKEIDKSKIEHMLLGSETKAKPSVNELAEKGQVKFNAITLENIASIG